jgi:hypothetical protein
MSRLPILSLAATAIVLFTATAASAAGPTREPAPAPDLTLTGVCSFPVLLHADRNTQTLSTFPDGTLFVRGGFASTATNTLTGKTISVSSTSGPLTIVTNPDGTTSIKGTGQNIFYFFAGDLGPGQPPALLLLDGLTTELIDATFTHVLSFEHHGRTTDVCALLS